MTPALAPDRSQEARQELALRLSARQDAVAFARAIGMEPAQHHELMLREVQAALDDAVDVVIVLAPPGSAKSTYVTICGPLFALARKPTADVILACHTAELAQGFGRRVRNSLMDAPWQRIAGGGVSIADDSAAAGRWHTSVGGSLYAVGVGGAVLGRRADYVFLDDLVPSFEVAMSETQLAKIAEWIKSDVLSRLKPGGKVVCVMQRMAHNDPAGFLSRYFAGTSTRVRTLTLPMVCEEPATDPLGREQGQSLWPEWYQPRDIERFQLDPVRWRTMYQQQPLVSTGEWCRPEWLSYRDEPRPEDMQNFIGVDLAMGTARGDFTAIVVVGVTRDQRGARHFHVREVFRERCDTLKATDALISLGDRYGASEAFIDDDNSYKALRHFIHERMLVRKKVVTLKALPLGGRDKETRAGALRALLADGRLHLRKGAAWVDALVRELLMFPTGGDAPGVDDQIDALGLVARVLMRTGAGPGPEKPSDPYAGWLFDPNRTDDKGQLLMSCHLDEMFEAHERANQGRARLA